MARLTKMLSAVTMALAAIVAWPSGSARAESPSPSPAAAPPSSAPGPGGPSEAMRRELLERLSAERAWRLVDGLKLDQATSAKMFPILSKYDDLFFALFSERRALGQQMRAELAAPAPNNARLTSLIDKVLALRTRRHTLESERLTELRRVLTPWQQARLLTLLPQIEGGFLRRIRHARDGEGPEGDGPEGHGEGGGSHRGGAPHGGFGLDEPF
jgi:Spy/CpxP family protein refolding chaperone